MSSSHHPALTIIPRDGGDRATDSETPRMSMSLFEYAKLLSYRSEALTHGATPTINMQKEGKGLTSAISIAKLELALRKCPLILVRRFPSGRTELVDPRYLAYSLME